MSVELLRRPGLRGRPVVVGLSDDPTRLRVVVTSASYEARAYGIRAGMPLRTAARRCPDAVFIAADPPAYAAASERVMATLRSFPVVVEVFGLDEAFLAARTDDPEELAREIRHAVAAETGLSCSVGIGDTKQRAKLATGFAKPAGIYRLTEDTWMTVMAERPTSALWGIGDKTAARLADAGVGTVAELAAADPGELARRFGPRIGPWLRELALGGGLGDVTAEPREPRSRSRAATFARDLASRPEIEDQLSRLARELATEVLAEGRRIVRVAVTVRSTAFFTRTKATTLTAPAGSTREIEAAALAVLNRFDLGRCGSWAYGWSSRRPNAERRRESVSAEPPARTSLGAVVRDRAPARTPQWGSWSPSVDGWAATRSLG